MADTFTTNLNLTKPEVGASTDTWGTKINADLDALDAIFAVAGTAVNVKFASANFDDNAKAIFGTGDDLEIYHDGSNSYIKDGGTGDLRIASNDLYIKNGADTETKAYFLDNGAVGLYFDDAVKFATTSSGATVTGTLVATLATAAQPNITSVGTLTALTVDEITINGDTITASDDFIIDVADDITFDADGGDIFFKDGGTQKMHLDATGRLLIGADSGDAFNDDAMLRLQRTGDRIFQSFKVDADQSAAIFFGDVDDDIECGIQYQAANRALEFSTGNNSEAMRIDSSGNVLVGATSAILSASNRGNVTINGASDSILNLGVGGNQAGYLYHNGTALNLINTKNGELKFFTNDLEKMRIDSSGNVGIGCTPSKLFEIAANGTAGSCPTIRISNTLSSGSWQSISEDLGRIEFFTEDASGNAPYSLGRITANNDALSGSRTLPSGALNFFTRGYNDASLTLAMTLSSGGALSKSSGSFKIDHPLESKKDTHHLVHSFVEAPQADNIYRGVVVLENGTASINLDTVSGMSEGTYVLLNTNTSCFTSNETDWDAVKGSVSGNILTISCQNTSSTATVSWLVIGERHDQHMKDTDWTDSDGKVIVEPTK